jgi:hypothetical protein
MADTSGEEVHANMPSVHHFDVSLNTLIDVVEAYRGRKFDEDLKFINTTLGGIDGLAGKLKTSIAEGIKGHDLEQRDEQFGSNKKSPPQTTGICKLFLMALDDLMLKILDICRR